jgi:alpha-L-fucosidase 2
MKRIPLLIALLPLVAPFAHAVEPSVSPGNDAPGAAGAKAAPYAPSSMIDMDFRRYLAPLNIRIDGPSEGIRTALPLGNGRTGALVVVGGKSKSQVLFDLGRSDVFYSGGGCTVSDKSPYNRKGVVAVVELDFGSPVFAACRQEVNVYDGVATASGEGVSLRMASWRRGDVLALEITDDRPVPADITLRLAMPVEGYSKNGYSAKVAFTSEAGVPGLRQVFEQQPAPGGKAPAFYCASSCKVMVPGRTLESTVKGRTQTTRIPAAKGKTVVYFASAAALSPDMDAERDASKALKTAKSAGYAAIEKSVAEDWHAFWEKSFILLPQTHDAPFSESVDQHWAFYLYSMGICGTGRFPANPDGAMFRTGVWGQPYWWFNGSRQSLAPAFEIAAHPEMADPWLDMLHNARPRFQKLAEQAWGCAPGAVFIPEVFTANGPEILPENIATKLRRTLLEKEKPDKELWAFATSRNTSQSQWTFTRAAGKPHLTSGAHSHLLYNTGEAAQWFWNRYAYTGTRLG